MRNLTRLFVGILLWLVTYYIFQILFGVSANFAGYMSFAVVLLFFAVVDR